MGSQAVVSAAVRKAAKSAIGNCHFPLLASFAVCKESGSKGLGQAMVYPRARGSFLNGPPTTLSKNQKRNRQRPKRFSVPAIRPVDTVAHACSVLQPWRCRLAR